MSKLKVAAWAKKQAKLDEWNDDVLDMSITIGLWGADVCKTDIEKLDRFL